VHGVNTSKMKHNAAIYIKDFQLFCIICIGVVMLATRFQC